MTTDTLLHLFALFLLLCAYLYIKDCKEKRVLEALLVASEIFVEWRKSNPGIYIGLSDTGKKLVTTLIEKHDDFYKIFTFIDGDEHRAYLMSLFDELPPKPHKPNPPSMGDFVFYIHFQTPLITHKKKSITGVVISRLSCYNYPHICQTQT